MTNLNPGVPGMPFPDLPRNADLDEYKEDDPVTTTDADIASGDMAEALDRRAIAEADVVDEDTLPDEDEYPRDSGS